MGARNAADSQRVDLRESRPELQTGRPALPSTTLNRDALYDSVLFVGVEGLAWISILCSFTPCKTWTRSMPSFRGLGESSTVQAGLMGIMRRPSTLLLVGVRPSDGTCNSVGTEPMPGLSTSPQCTIQLCLSRFYLLAFRLP